jgi:UDP-N-acetylmuramyl pentapeptide phosphotransferase/UDP-N-acetylglucosamine-1-phosphate transferase
MIALSVAFLISMVVTLLVVHYEHLHSHITADHDTGGVQKFHAHPVPRVGGLGVMMGLLAGLVAKWFIEPEIGSFGLVVMVAALPAFLVGLVEDLTKKVSVSKRLFATALSAVLGGVLLGAWLMRLDVPVIDAMMSIGAVSVAITAFAVAGVANAFNLIDGYNGLSGMVAVIILAGLAYVADQVGDRPVMIMAYATAGSILGFLVWNYPRGLIFLGDGGAYLIGFLVAELSVLLVTRNPQVSPWFPLLLSFYPIFETLFTIFRRVVISKSHPGLPDAAHLHQLIYRRMVRWAVGDDCPKKKIRRNSMTSPYLWVMATLAVLPATLFWRSTEILQTTALLFASFYVFAYWKIVRNRVPRFLMIKNSKDSPSNDERPNHD